MPATTSVAGGRKDVTSVPSKSCNHKYRGFFDRTATTEKRPRLMNESSAVPVVDLVTAQLLGCVHRLIGYLDETAMGFGVA